jgi:hypothetical protein
MKLSQARLKELLNYDPGSGEFTWKAARRGIQIGWIAGHVWPDGYRKITIDGQPYQAHHLAWLYVHGKLPRRIDHKDGQRDHNSIDNLRLATQSQNRANSRRSITNTSGFKGVSWDPKTQNWRPGIMKDGKTVRFGRFSTAEEAHRAYVAKAVELFGEFARAE